LLPLVPCSSFFPYTTLFRSRFFLFSGAGLCRLRLQLALVADLIGPAALDAHQLAHVAGMTFIEDRRAAEVALFLGVSGTAQVRRDRKSTRLNSPPIPRIRPP